MTAFVEWSLLNAPRRKKNSAPRNLSTPCTPSSPANPWLVRRSHRLCRSSIKEAFLRHDFLSQRFFTKDFSLFFDPDRPSRFAGFIEDNNNRSALRSGK